jgi:hypothetical protein
LDIRPHSAWLAYEESNRSSRTPNSLVKTLTLHSIEEISLSDGFSESKPVEDICAADELYGFPFCYEGFFLCFSFKFRLFFYVFGSNIEILFLRCEIQLFWAQLK